MRPASLALDNVRSDSLTLFFNRVAHGGAAPPTTVEPRPGLEPVSYTHLTLPTTPYV